MRRRPGIVSVVPLSGAAAQRAQDRFQIDPDAERAGLDVDGVLEFAVSIVVDREK